MSALHDAAQRYRTAEANLTTARARSAGVRRHGTTRDANRANDAALAARIAYERARDDLVTAALEHDCGLG